MVLSSLGTVVLTLGVAERGCRTGAPAVGEDSRSRLLGCEDEDAAPGVEVDTGRVWGVRPTGATGGCLVVVLDGGWLLLLLGVGNAVEKSPNSLFVGLKSRRLNCVILWLYIYFFSDDATIQS